MSIYLKSGLLGAALLLCQPVCALDLVPFSHDASVLDKLTLTHTDTPELKPIPSQSVQIAAAQFLPEVQDSEFGFSGNSSNNSHNQNSCSGFALSACPPHGTCSSCVLNPSLKRLDHCASGWKIDANTCLPSSCQTLGYQAEIPLNQICDKITQSGLTCYNNCRSLNCAGYTLNCDSFNVANAGSKEICADCNDSNANCSPKLCKVKSCMDGYKIADNGTACIELDDTCANGYYKTCETGTQGDPQFTEKGTACYQCKPKTPECPTGYSPLHEEGYSHDFVYGEECQDKREFVYYKFDSRQILGGRIIPQPYLDNENAKTLTATLAYGKLLEELKTNYFEPSAEQIASPERIVTSCDEFESALKDSSVYNIRISGKISCHSENYYYTYGGHKQSPNGYLIPLEKNIYGTDKAKDILEFTGKVPYLSAAALHLSNLTLDIPIDMNNLLLSQVPGLDLSPYILTVAENVDIIGGTNSLKQDIFFKNGDNHLYFKYKQPSDGLDSGSIVIGENAKVYYHGMDHNSMSFENIILFGELIPTEDLTQSYSTPSADNLFMQGNNKTFRGITLNNGSFIDFTRWPSTHLHIVGNNSSVSVKDSGHNIAIGDNSTYWVRENIYEPNLAMGKNAKFAADKKPGFYSPTYAQTSNNYKGEYTYITTSDWKNKDKFY